MRTDNFLRLINCSLDDPNLRVVSRERRDLEFKRTSDENSVRKCVKTISAFANLNGGSIVFGVAENPRRVVGVQDFMDEAAIQDLLTKHLYPVPEIEIFEHNIGGFNVVQVCVLPCRKAPVIAIKDLQTRDERNSTILSQGTIYFRRAGRTKPISGEECAAILEKRDQAVRESILGLIARAGEIGFENVTLADFRKYGNQDDNVTLYVPESAAKELNIIDKAKVVASGAVPAYQIRGAVRLTASTDKDPRKPLLPERSARALRQAIREKFWPDFPWGAVHLRWASEHLGFWDNNGGDGVHTGTNEVTGGPVYFEDGRAAVQRFANRSPEAFVEVVGSVATKERYRRGQ